MSVQSITLGGSRNSRAGTLNHIQVLYRVAARNVLVKSKKKNEH